MNLMGKKPAKICHKNTTFIWSL